MRRVLRSGNAFGTYRAERDAVRALESLGAGTPVVLQVVRLESGPGSCVGLQMGRCNGACVGKESARVHLARVKLGLMAQRLKPWPHEGPMLLREGVGERSSITSSMVGSISAPSMATRDAQAECAAGRDGPNDFDIETYRIITRELRDPAQALPCREVKMSRVKCRFPAFRGPSLRDGATGTLLAAGGLKLSEPMLFGLGEGLGFIFINLRSLPLPFVGGRTKPFAVTEALCTNLGLACTAVETASKKKAWAELETPLRAGQPVGLQLDCFHLEYFSRPVHFAGHFVAAHGFDDREVLLVDTAPQGSMQRTSRASLEKARFAKGPMAAKARSWTIAPLKRAPALDVATRKAIRANAKQYLTPAFKGASHLGILKLAESLPGWIEIAKRPAEDLALASLLMERAGTGGSLFRNFYRDFLCGGTRIPGRCPRDAHPGASAVRGFCA